MSNGRSVGRQVLVGAPAASGAAVIIIGQSGGTQLGQSCGSGGNTTGWKFTVGAADLLASSLGAFDQDGEGLGMSAEVGLGDSAGTLCCDSACTQPLQACNVPLNVGPARRSRTRRRRPRRQRSRWRRYCSPPSPPGRGCAPGRPRVSPGLEAVAGTAGVSPAA